ncbi:hypothetical protein [Oceanobacillus sp. J11TS1]|uniref:hypothetical protein n=1 Tax=Oceanobacillus sp. J11TS1 TaxID=2807191 RepID=UPI001B1FCFDE|nr:hypothetical protein [Oceanobacillus sp. J11TS1]GIO25051.1 hypothetical protein J11TS1_36320 [Oceanobacillus sp. J11TS1]
MFKHFTINQVVLPLDFEIKLKENDIAFSFNELFESIPEEAFGIGNVGVFLTQAAWFPLKYIDSLSTTSATIFCRSNGRIASAYFYGRS